MIPSAQGRILFLPLGPSTNARMRPVRMGRLCRQILTKEAKEYMDSIGAWLWAWRRQAKYPTVTTYRFFDFWFVLPRTNCDSHNYFKVLNDTIEYGEIVANDKFILPRVMGVSHDSKNPHVAVRLPQPAALGRSS